MASSVLRPSVDGIRKLGNFTQIFRWNVSFEKIPNGISISSEDINFRAESSTVPTLTGTSTEIVIRGNKVRQPGIHGYNSPITLTLMETVDNKIANFIKEWREKCWKISEGSAGVSENKDELEAVIVLTRLNNKDEAIWRYKLIGCYLEGAERGDLDAQTADPMKPALAIAYDRFEEEAV